VVSVDETVSLKRPADVEAGVSISHYTNFCVCGCMWEWPMLLCTTVTSASSACHPAGRLEFFFVISRTMKF
jgi:hypothetical protein